ncbi:DUF421 domain-containing protein [Peribacillus deserti]|uniref:YetF C-terminal domain-containing protein n=1 Tax=Peribacillus deserti TaxID=673318 RepID=A0A2N5M5D4_9BACI|nr:DUF421 domain-containing protein [Peribacillus deserti]PLT29574.1 hypothetical protein CUU66_12720 [Peribacillus deserti]
MDFFHGQPTLTAMEWILRAVVSFSFLMIIAKVLGQRAISQLRLLDFVIALVIGNIIAHPLSDEELGLEGSIITTIVLVLLYLLGIYSILKWPWFRRLINVAPITIVQNGNIIYEGLKKARITIDILLEELREKKVADVQKVALATFEADGRISVFLDPKYEPVTPALMQMKTEGFDMPRTIIMEGIINSIELERNHKNEDWLASELERLYQTEVKNVLLATLDQYNKLKVFLYK